VKLFLHQGNLILHVAEVVLQRTHCRVIRLSRLQVCDRHAVLLSSTLQSSDAWQHARRTLGSASDVLPHNVFGVKQLVATYRIMQFNPFQYRAVSRLVCTTVLVAERGRESAMGSRNLAKYL